MKTNIKNWSVVTVDDFKIAWGIVIADDTGRFEEDDFVRTSKITERHDNHVTTKSGSVYQLVGEGTECIASYKQLFLLGAGISPQELNLEDK